MGLPTILERVKQFMRVFKQEYSDTPNSSVNPDIIRLRLRLHLEELEELFFAVLDNTSAKIVHNDFKKINSFLDTVPNSAFVVNIVETADALTDIEYINNGTAAVFGIPLDETFTEVHRSNMSKLDANGQPIFRADGKVIKSDLYSPPDLLPILKSHGFAYE